MNGIITARELAAKLIPHTTSVHNVELIEQYTAIIRQSEQAKITEEIKFMALNMDETERLLQIERGKVAGLVEACKTISAVAKAEGWDLTNLNSVIEKLDGGEL